MAYKFKKALKCLVRTVNGPMIGSATEITKDGYFVTIPKGFAGAGRYFIPSANLIEWL